MQLHSKNRRLWTSRSRPMLHSMVSRCDHLGCHQDVFSCAVPMENMSGCQRQIPVSKPTCELQRLSRRMLPVVSKSCVAAARHPNEENGKFQLSNVVPSSWNLQEFL